MSGENNWAAERTRLRPVHRRIESRILELLREAGRTWERLPYGDRQGFLMRALQGMDPVDVYRWGQRYSLGDVLNRITTPSPGAHASARVGRAGNDH